VTTDINGGPGSSYLRTALFIRDGNTLAELAQWMASQESLREKGQGPKRTNTTKPKGWPGTRDEAGRGKMGTLTMNIKREFFADIVAGTKRVEVRPTSKFWRRRIEPLSAPFRLRLLNGMTHPIPEALVVVKRVTRARGDYLLHLGKVLMVRWWNRRAQKPSWSSR
jgi:hypothetical protein